MKLPWQKRPDHRGIEKRNSKPNRVQLGFECLEARTVPAGLDPLAFHISNPGSNGPWFSLQGQVQISIDMPDTFLLNSTTGMLTINGASNDDIITIDKPAANWRITVNGATYSADEVMGITVNARLGNDTVNVRKSVVGVPITVNGDGGNDTVNLGSAASLMDGIESPVTIHDNSGTDTININDQGNAAGFEYMLTGSRVSRGATTVAIYDGTEDLGVNAGRGSDTLTAPNAANTWNITANNAGTLTGNVRFSSFENLKGGTEMDMFVFSNGRSVSGTIDGRSGSDALDYTAYTTAVAVSLPRGLATGTAGIQRIENVLGGAGDDVVIGDSSANILRGGAGRDLVIGGAGADIIYGDDGQDILISGTTDYDANDIALLQIMSEWMRADQTYAQRIDHLRNGGGNNGQTRLTWTTVHEDDSTDTMRGGDTALDWFFASNWDDLPDLSNLERLDRFFLADLGSPLGNPLPPIV